MTINVRQLVNWFLENRDGFVNEFRHKLVAAVEAVQKQAMEKARLREKTLAELERRFVCHTYNGWDLNVRVYSTDRAHARSVGKIHLKPQTYSRSDYEGEVEFPVYNPDLLVSNETYQRLRNEVISRFDPEIEYLVSARDVAEQRLQNQLARFERVFKRDLDEGDLGIILEVLTLLEINLSVITVEDEAPRLRVVTEAA